MHKTIVISDLTKMGGEGVCIVGIDQNYQSIRPVLPPPGVLRKHLFKGIIRKRLVIRPKAKITFDFHKVPIEPPHIEDLGFNPKSIVYEGLCTDAEWEKLIKAISFRSVQDIYDDYLKEDRWVEPGTNTRSLGTVSQIQVISVNLQERSGERRYRLYFTDQTGHQYDNVTISDLAFRALCDAELNRRSSLLSASQWITDQLKSVDLLYLNFGLARPWAPSDGSFGPRCWMQVTGIYTFPDYLGGKSFADFETTMQPSKTKAYDVEEIRAEHPKAYTKWTEEEDNILRNEYFRGKTVEELASKLQRKPGAIRSRLIRLGLLK
ncbi:MAG TPA: hypothetical protein VMX96_11065 [Dehalococcoidia bacterium]|nr:hypothetical protein [Dehalococcoidia bacterium]